MVKRTIATGVWFLAVWTIGGATALFLDVSRWAALAPALIAAVAVWMVLGSSLPSRDASTTDGKDTLPRHHRTLVAPSER